METSLKDMYSAFIKSLKIEQINLRYHVFQVISGLVSGKKLELKINNKLADYAQAADTLVVNYTFHLSSIQEDSEIWKAEYQYNVVFKHSVHEQIEAIFKDEELKKAFEHRQMITFLWPYLRQEVQADTQKANMPALLLPPR